MPTKIYETISCECGHVCPIEFAIIDEDGIYTCPNCVIKEINDRLAYGITKLIGDVEKQHKDLKHKNWDWRSFYNGWIQGRTQMLIEIKGLGE